MTHDISVEPTVVAQVTINGAETSLEKGLAEFSIGDEVEETVDVELDESNSLEAVADDIDEALKELGALEAQTPATMTVTFGFDGGLKFDEVKAKNLKVKFPDFLVFEKGEVEEGNTLTLNETLSTTPRKLNVIGYRFGDKPGEGIPVVDGNISIKKEVFMQGVVQVVNASGSGELKMTMYVTLDEMTVNSVTGVIQPNIEAETTKIELNDLPDFLKDEDTRLDITNPVILLKADNPLETDVEIDAVLTPKKNNVNIEGHEVKIGTGYGQNKVALIPGTNIIALSRTGECSIEGVTENIKVEDINNLLETIPDDIDVNLQPIVRNENYYNAELGKEYDLPASVPCKFTHLIFM